MRLFVLLSLVFPVGLPTDTPQAKPPAPPQAPAPQAPAQAPAAEEETQRSLFEQTWRQFQAGVRSSSVDGDPARFQRYEDIRDGFVFTDAKFANEDPAGNWAYRLTADKLAWRDQRYTGTYERIGKFAVSGSFDSIPQFYSVDTMTPYTKAADGALVLDDATQQRIQNGQAGTPPLAAYVPLAPQFDLTERRDTGHVRFIATPKQELDITAAFTSTRHSGELPWGASYGFSNDVEVALPYDSKTNDFSLGAEWRTAKNMLRVGYNGSWFDNLDDTLVWDSPLRLTDASGTPGRGRMALWPSNSAQTISFGGYHKMARRTQVTGFFSVGFWNNDEPLQPFTINTALAVIPLPRATTQGDATVVSTNLNLVSRPNTDWRVSSRFRVYDYNNNTPHASIPEFINYDSSVKVSSTGGPEPYAHSRLTFDADATYTGLQPVALTVGYTRNNSSHDFRIFESTGEDVLRLTADMVGSSYVTFRAQYELASKGGSGLDEEILTQIGEQPDLRHYDIANRGRNRFTGQVDIMPNEFWTFSLGGGGGKDTYDDSYFGLRESTVGTFSAAVDFRQPDGYSAGATYSFEDYSGLQRSRSASPGQNPPQETDPNRDWTTDSTERVHYIAFYVAPPPIKGKTELRLTYDYSHAEGSYLYTVVPGGPLPAPSQLPNVFNKLAQFRLDARHRLSNRLAAVFQYLYEPFKVFDFAFDPSVINGIAQPSSLVLGYVYRPYTAHSFNVGLRYYW